MPQFIENVRVSFLWEEIMKARGLLHHTPPEELFGERFSPYMQSVNTHHNQRHLVVHIREDNIQGSFL